MAALGTIYENIRFRTAILDTIPHIGTPAYKDINLQFFLIQARFIDATARKVIPSMAPLSPHVPLARHLRHIVPLVRADEHGTEYFATYTDAVERARYASDELTEAEFEAALDAVAAIRDM